MEILVESILNLLPDYAQITCRRPTAKITGIKKLNDFSEATYLDLLYVSTDPDLFQTSKLHRGNFLLCSAEDLPADLIDPYSNLIAVSYTHLQVDARIHHTQQRGGSRRYGSLRQQLAEMGVVHFETKAIKDSADHHQRQATVLGSSEVDDNADTEEQDTHASGKTLKKSAPNSGIEQAAYRNGNGKNRQNICSSGSRHAHAAGFHSRAGDNGYIGHESIGEQQGDKLDNQQSDGHRIIEDLYKRQASTR